MEHPGKNILTEDDTYRALMRPTINELERLGHLRGYILYAIIPWGAETRNWVKIYHWTEIELKEYALRNCPHYNDSKREKLRLHIEELKKAERERG